ncbi:MAG: type VI secretion system baseplate subunit TssF [Chitinophagaceae bacterium]|nr:type VI secretion system baseplate subunit TssF [Chitinophagaceae bacterium]
MQETREEIKNRMIRTAAKIWGYPEINAENEFDPLVSLLLNVNAAEFERLSDQSAASRTRILERMIQVMTPEILTGALPAHAVVHAVSTNEQDTILPQEQFTSGTDQQTFFFAPAARTSLSRHLVKYVATSHNFYQYKAGNTKEIIEHRPDNTAIANNTVWLGLTNAQGALHRLQFFFQADMLVEKNMFYSQLPHTIWMNGNGQPLKINPGYNNNLLNENNLDVKQILEQDVSINSVVLKNINDIYRHQFVTVSETRRNNHKKTPAEIENSFPEKISSMLGKEHVYWIKISFPENIHSRLLQEVNYYANCFPVVNKQLYELTYELKDFINILPLLSNSHFFDLEEVITQEGTVLNVRNVHNTDERPLKIVLRSGGVSRFDDRDAAAAIENIIQLLRDDSAAFSAIGKNFVAQEMKHLQQVINRLSQQLLQKNIQQIQSPHLIVKGTKEHRAQSIFVKYWSTDGVAANGIKVGTQLVAYKSNAISYHDAFFITPTIGGRNALTPTDKVTAYKHALLSKNRIISREDIQLYCRLTMGDRLKEVIVEKGIMISGQINQGYIKTLDITLKMTKLAYLSFIENNELEYWREYIWQQLTNRSQSLTPYRVFIEEA